MKAIFIALALAVATVASFAQGKITIGNDSTHLIVNDFAFPVSQTTGWDKFTMELWGGTSVGSMTLQTTIVGAAIGNPAFADGRINNTLLTLFGIPGGVTASFQLRFLYVYRGNIEISGLSPVFTMVPGTFAPNPIVLPGSPSFSTWAAGNIVLNTHPFPEPSSLALGGVSAACLLLFRRRN